MPGVTHQHLLELAVLDQRVIHRHAVNPGGLHRHMRHPLRHQPPSRLLQHPIERGKRPGDRLPTIGTLPGQPHRHRDHVLAHIDPGAPLMFPLICGAVPSLMPLRDPTRS